MNITSITEHKTNINITKIKKCKKKTEQHFYSEDKNSQTHSQFKIYNEHLKNINKIEKYKKLNMMEHIKLLKLANSNKMKSISMTEHKTDMNITKMK